MEVVARGVLITKHYTIIGSRSTPTEIKEVMSNLACRLAKQGWIGRSDGYDGADESNVIPITQYKIYHLLNQAKGE